MTRPPARPIRKAILNEAADWFVLLESGEATGQDRAAFAQWCQRSAEHAAAWERAEYVQDLFRKVSPHIGLRTRARLGRSSRWDGLRLALLAGVILIAWMAWRSLWG